jgi:hypothetical protein
MHRPRKQVHGTCSQTRLIEVLGGYSNLKKLKHFMAVKNTDAYLHHREAQK